MTARHSTVETDGATPVSPAAHRRTHRQEIRTADRQAMRIAARQWGVLTRAQALKAGLTGDQVIYRLRTGQWRQAAHGVYVVAGTPSRWEQKAMIACLAGPDGTVASHLTAAALFGLGKPPPVPQVTVGSQASGRFRGAAVFRGRIGPGEACTRSRIPCTSPARTVVDCAAAGLL
ncbi:MAG: type IV toxin-antitoxin system AbiEi family antitoxin domain-containing protein [Actinomycetota bacterium]|jgi:hypothetical protein